LISSEASGEWVSFSGFDFSIWFSIIFRNLAKYSSQTADVPFKIYFFALLIAAFAEAMAFILATHSFRRLVFLGISTMVCLFVVVTLVASCVKVLLMSKSSSFSQNASFKQLKERWEWLEESDKSIDLSHFFKILDGSGGDRIGYHDSGAGNHRSPQFFERWRRLRISNRLWLDQMLLVATDSLGFPDRQINEESHQVWLLDSLIFENLISFYVLYDF
jgi:hypothetical protein